MKTKIYSMQRIFANEKRNKLSLTDLIINPPTEYRHMFNEKSC